ncbi:MAG: hypothetical protein ISS45_01180 [Candidatus Omnitrophica bacterium]|nr:hypothetical protein [Candidatus Omnitrophota bacterium]
MQRKVVLILILVLFLLCGMSIYLLRSNLSLKESLKEIPGTEEAKKKTSLERKKLKEDLKRDLEEKYQADMVSYQAMIKRLELEKKKQKELKEKIEQLEKEPRKK